MSFAPAGVYVASSLSSWAFVVNAIGMRSGNRTCSASGLRHAWRTACSLGVCVFSSCEIFLVSLVGRVVRGIVPSSGLEGYEILWRGRCL